MIEHLQRYPWVLPIYRYQSQDHLIDDIDREVISVAERKREELLRRWQTLRTQPALDWYLTRNANRRPPRAACGASGARAGEASSPRASTSTGNGEADAQP
jgi:hypothetical protein